MSFYDDASLVVIPSGYKTSKVYAEKPTDGSGDLAFTRTGDTATRVNSAGLIEKVRTNLILQSQTFDNASWGKDTTTVTANAEIAPDGTLTAETMTISTDASRVTQGPTINAGSFTASVYVKVISQTTAGDVRFLGVVDGSVVNVNFTPTNQWVRYAATFTATTQITSLQLRGATGGFVGTIAIWGFQVEASDFGATAYIPTTTAAVSVGPVANVPRLDYLGSTCPRLLLEPQRTNLITFSEQLDNAAYTAVSCTVSANAATSPDGYTNADSISTTAANSFFGAASAVTISADASTYTQSVFVKWVSGSEIVKLRVALTSGTSVAKETIANVRTGVITYTDSTAQIVSYGNGWYRISQQVTNNSTNTNFNYQFYPTNDGTNTNVIRLWGCMAEIGAYATSYIPTLAASATRGADACSKTGISSLIGQTQGTLFVEFDFDGNYDTNGILAIDVLGAGGNEAYIYITGAGQLRLELYVASAIQGFILSSIGAVGRKKIAFAYKANDFVGYMNGVQIGTDTSGTVGAMDTIYVGTYQQPTYATGAINQTLLFKTRLTNSELAELTSL